MQSGDHAGSLRGVKVEFRVPSASEREAPGGEAVSWASSLVLPSILLLALVVRLAFLASWARNPLFWFLTGDEENFHQTALGLLGRGPAPEGFLYQPLYSFFLALVYSVVGPNVGQVRLVHLMVGVVNVWLLWAIGRELGGRWAGNMSGLIGAVFGPFVFLEGQMLAPVLTVPLLAGGLLCCMRGVKVGRSLRLFPAVSLICLATMARPNLALLLPVCVGWFLWRMPAGKPRLEGLAAALLGVVIGLSPSWLYNVTHGLSLVPVSASGGHSFFIGNNPQANGLFNVPAGEGIDASSHHAYRATLTAAAQRAEGRDLTLAEVSSYWFRRGLGFWREHPAQALRITGWKLLLSLNNEEIPIHHPYSVIAEMIPLLRVLPGFGPVFAMSVLGMVLGRRRQGTGFLAACSLAYLASVVAFYVADRYRILLLPMLIPLAGLGLVELAAGLRRRKYRELILGFGLGVAAFAIAQVQPYPERIYRYYRVRTYMLMGTSSARAGRERIAEELYRQAIALSGPRQGAVARANLGAMLEERGELDEAHALYVASAEIDPEMRFVRLRLARLAERRENYTEAVRWWKELAELSADPTEALSEIARLERLLQLRRGK